MCCEWFKACYEDVLAFVTRVKLFGSVQEAPIPWMRYCFRIFDWQFCKRMPRWFTSSCFTADLLDQSAITMAVLELSHCSLTNVPSEIFKSKEGKNLEEVYLDANQLRDLPRVSLMDFIAKLETQLCKDVIVRCHLEASSWVWFFSSAGL